MRRLPTEAGAAPEESPREFLTPEPGDRPTPILALELVVSGRRLHVAPIYADAAVCGARLEGGRPVALGVLSLSCRRCAAWLPEEA